MWEAAFVWVLGEEMAIFHLDHFTNSIRHICSENLVGRVYNE